MSFIIVPAGPADAEALAAVHVQSWRETYRGLLPSAYLEQMSTRAHARRLNRALAYPSPQDVTLVAADRAGVVGYVAGGASRTRFEGESEVASLYVLRAAQGRGLGRRLLTAAARALWANDAVSLAISALHDNAAACAFYARMGGVAEPPRPQRGPGGIMLEVLYRWPDIAVLADRPPEG